MTVIDLPRPALADRSWTVGAACARKGVPADLWHADAVTARAMALHICRSHCPVLDPCHTEAVAYRDSPDRYQSTVVGGQVYNHDGKKLTVKPTLRCPICRPDTWEWPQLRPNRRGGGGRPRGPARQVPCGTEAAYARHRRRGEPIDEACRAAHNAAGTVRKAEQRRRCDAGECQHAEHQQQAVAS